MTTTENNGSQANYGPAILPRFKELVTSSSHMDRRAQKTRAASKQVKDAK